MNADDDGRTDTEHYADTAENVEDRGGDIDGGKAAGTCTVADECPVRQIQYDNGKHADDGRHKKLPEDMSDRLVRKIYRIPVIHE